VPLAVVQIPQPSFSFCCPNPVSTPFSFRGTGLSFLQGHPASQHKMRAAAGRKNRTRPLFANRVGGSAAMVDALDALAR
jgi:hypothetical protein